MKIHKIRIKVSEQRKQWTLIFANRQCCLAMHLDLQSQLENILWKEWDKIFQNKILNDKMKIFKIIIDLLKFYTHSLLNKLSQ